jgi:hypothetical protein
MTLAEVVWLSGLFIGTVLGLPLGIVIDRIVLRPSVRVLLSHRADGPRRGA